MPLPFWNNDSQAESAATVDEIVAERRNQVANLVGEAEALLESVRLLIAGDRDIGVRYASATIAPWRDEITAAFQAFRDEVVGNLPALAEATRLVRSGDARIAAVKFGSLLTNIRQLEARLGELKRQRPQGLSRVGLHEAMRVRPRPGLPVEKLLEILFEGAPQSDLGLITIEDVTSRLKVEEGVDPTAFTLHRGTYVERVWNAEVIATELAKQPVQAALAQAVPVEAEA